MVSDYKIMYHTLKSLSAPGVGEASLLKALQLYHYEEEGEDEEIFGYEGMKEGLVPFGGKAPNLRHVALWGVHVDWERTGWLEGLEDLELAYHTKVRFCHTRHIHPSFINSLTSYLWFWLL